MTFDQYLSQAWSDHATDSGKVSKTFQEGLALVENDGQLMSIIGLMTHVMGEHLAQWKDGVNLLQALNTHPGWGTESEQAVARSVAALQIAGQIPSQISNFSSSDQIRIKALASSALAEKDLSRAQVLLKEALDLASRGLDAKDPANRALAVTGNNLAATFEEKESRTADENEFMLLCARTARKYWELAGTKSHILSSESRLAMSHFKAGMPERARGHAQTCLEICQEITAEPWDFFYGYEALALAEKNLGNELGFQTAASQAEKYFDLIPKEHQHWYAKSMKQLKSIISASV